MATKTKRIEQVGEPVPVGTNHWVVFGAEEQPYQVTWNGWWDCTCGDHAYRHQRNGTMCKHAGAAWAQELEAFETQKVVMAS